MRLEHVENLRRGMVAAEDIFPPGEHVVPYLRKNTVLTDSIISEMRRLGIKFTFVKNKVDREPNSDGPAPGLPPVRKPKPLLSTKAKESAVDTLQDLYTSVRIGAEDVHSAALIVKQLDTVVDHLVDSIMRDSSIMVNINDLKSYDDYTYHHSLSVAVLSIAIGQYMGYGRGQLNHIGMASMMHDIGKTAVPLEIINKTSRLDDNEFRVIQTHSSAGYDYLKNTGYGDEELRRAVLHHHEKYDGTGYPDGIKGEDIPLESRIISVADVYDALTSTRPYRTPMEPPEAIEYIMGSSGTAFDYDVIMAFIKKVELYPVGERVQFSNGRIGTVISNENPMRPVVRMQSGEIVDLYRDRASLSMVITKLLPGG